MFPKNQDMKSKNILFKYIFKIKSERGVVGEFHSLQRIDNNL